VPRLYVVYPDICFTTEVKSRKILSQCNRRALGCSAPNAVRLVGLDIAGGGLDWPAVHCRPWLSRHVTGSTIGQRNYLPSCRTRWFPTSGNFESKLSGNVRSVDTPLNTVT
jgi:hypothetical protein